MICPINAQHEMVEIAEGVHQCPFCGYGPSQAGYHGFWSVANVEITAGCCNAVVVRFDDENDCFVLTEATWTVNLDGSRYGALVENAGMVLSTEAELASAPLPAIVRSKAKWDYPPGKPTLKRLSFQPLGPKEISLSSERPGRS